VIFQDVVGAWLSNDDANHRIALLAFPNFAAGLGLEEVHAKAMGDGYARIRPPSRSRERPDTRVQVRRRRRAASPRWLARPVRVAVDALCRTHRRALRGERRHVTAERYGAVNGRAGLSSNQ
jgi:hypothetical protein